MSQHEEDEAGSTTPAEAPALLSVPVRQAHIEEMYGEYPVEKRDALCSTKTRLCACIVETEGLKAAVPSAAAQYVDVISPWLLASDYKFSPDVPSRRTYSLLLDGAAPDLHMK